MVQLSNVGKVRPITIIIGASSGIAEALTERICEQEKRKVYRVSRNVQRLTPHDLAVDFESDYSELSVAKVAEQMRGIMHRVERIIICNGLLHNDRVFPEKQMREFTADKFLTVMQATTIVPQLWLSALSSRLPSKQVCAFTVFSARVGSISDNRLGGWYSYRASKAALNMLVKTAAQELRRTHPKVSCLLFHPGTTDTELSKPFQQRVDKDKLFTPAFVAHQLLAHMANLAQPGELKFIDWAGEDIEF